MEPDDIAYVLYLSTIFEPLAIFSYIFPKIAVVILINKLMGIQKRGVWFLYFLLVILFISSALAVIFPFAQCDPPSHFWHPMRPAKCWSPKVLRDTTIFAGSRYSCFSLFAFTDTSSLVGIRGPLSFRVSCYAIMEPANQAQAEDWYIWSDGCWHSVRFTSSLSLLLCKF